MCAKYVGKSNVNKAGLENTFLVFQIDNVVIY